LFWLCACFNVELWIVKSVGSMNDVCIDV